MYRVVIPLLFFLGTLAVGGCLIAWVVSMMQRRARLSQARTDAEVGLIEYQSRTSMEDIERHRRRVNEGIDEQFEAQRRNPQDL